jgi:DNA-binding transcriptional LysR family regulator
MDLRKLTYFVAVAKASSFTAAAEILHVSQPALGLQVKELERRLGATLLIRHGRGVKLTSAGATLLREAEQILAACDRAERALENFRAPARRIILFGATPASPSQSLLPPLIAAGGQRNPVLHVSVRQGFSDELRGLVETGGLDAALCSDPAASDHAISLDLFSERLFLIGAAGALPTTGDDISFSELSRFPLVLDRRSRILRAEIERVARTEAISIGEALEIEPRELKRELILNHGRFAIVPFETFSEEIAHGHMSGLQIAKPAIVRRQSLLIKRSLPNDVRAFIADTITAEVERLAGTRFLGWELSKAGEERSLSGTPPDKGA